MASIQIAPAPRVAKPYRYKEAAGQKSVERKQDSVITHADMNKVPVGSMAIVRAVLAHWRLSHRKYQITSESSGRADIRKEGNRTCDENTVVEGHISELERVKKRGKIFVLVEVLLAGRYRWSIR